MKKLFLSAMGAMMLATSGFAQDIFDAGEQDPYLGVRASLDITGVAGNISNIYDFNNGVPAFLSVRCTISPYSKTCILSQG